MTTDWMATKVPWTQIEDPERRECELMALGHLATAEEFIRKRIAGEVFVFAKHGTGEICEVAPQDYPLTEDELALLADRADLSAQLRRSPTGYPATEFS